MQNDFWISNAVFTFNFIKNIRSIEWSDHCCFYMFSKYTGCEGVYRQNVTNNSITYLDTIKLHLHCCMKPDFRDIILFLSYISVLIMWRNDTWNQEVLPYVRTIYTTNKFKLKVDFKQLIVTIFKNCQYTRHHPVYHIIWKENNLPPLMCISWMPG